MGIKNNDKKIWAIMPAAGVGSRMELEFPKQYLEIAGKAIIQHTVERLLKLPPLNGLVICLAENDRWFSGLGIKDSRIILTTGGDTRADSVMNGLDRLSDIAHDDDWALVHDAARPCVVLSDIQSMISELHDEPVGGILAVKAKDTLKRASLVSGESFSDATIDRNEIWHAQTPQMIRYAKLRIALRTCREKGVNITDEASALEFVGESVRLCEGSAHNIKVTTPEDRDLAEYLLSR